jgi:4-hydroxy-3-polyprenylbenzoate decarboxylase
MRLVVGISGATGAIFGIRLLQMLRSAGVKTDLIISEWAKVTIQQETEFTVPEVEALASETHSNRNLAAAISSGSVKTDGMIIAPCSMKTVAAIRGGLASDLLSRAADVVLKERRKLVLLPRESPFNDIHLDNMLTLSRMGVVMVPPVPAFYNNPKSLDDVINHIVVRTLDQFGIDSPNASVWNGLARKVSLQNQHLPDREDQHGCYYFAGVPG